MTSMGGKVDSRINDGRHPYIFKLSGQNHHRIGTLLPNDGQDPQFAQLYFYDTENEVENRMNIFSNGEIDSDLDPSIVDALVQMFDETNTLVKIFRMSRDRFFDTDVHHLRLRLIGSRTTDGREYNVPTCSEIATIIIGDIGAENAHRDIIVELKEGGLQRINVLHPSYMALQYPLLFPYGEDGFRLGILYSNVDGIKSDTTDSVTMREYYAYRLQEREHEGHTLVNGGRLFQQFVVDAYTCIEEIRLMWVKENQDKLRIELYKGLKDAVMRGDTTPASSGKRFVLPSSFTGSLRYMIENYQDAMAICRRAGYPDLFITFTCNTKWPEIDLFLSRKPGQKVEDRPDVIARVFKIKLDQLLYDLKHVVYTVEYQKRGLPHAHILLFLHRDDKHPTAAEIDRIISAKILDLNEDSLVYEAVKQYMVHGPCGSINSKASCMIENKCTKHFPKKFCSQTTVDEDGFPIYRRRNNGRFVERNEVKLGNRFIVPYNIELLVKFQAHINVEWCNRSRSIKSTCYALGLLDDDKEWQLLSKDILHRQRTVLRYDNLHLDDFQLQNYALCEIEQILIKSGRSLHEFETIPYPNTLLLRQSNNRVLQEELDYDRNSLAAEHIKLLAGLNIDQRNIYDEVINSVSKNKGGFFFVYGHGGTRKTYLWKTIICQLRSEGKIVIVIASSGIAALLLPGGRTAYSRFQIPINVTDNSSSGIKQGSQIAELMSKASLIVWDEAPMAHRNCFEAVDRSLRDILCFSNSNSAETPFGGKTIVLGGDFRQILPMISKG
ncbi:uncharacterized protein LOC142634842 [Castanea sativa]|uniref:uncharacterized protein LOC142634842 n=1 Tax=Castanea sativa TaxID=21020 RepID=UPI003F64B879